jgi:hypothetical protein
VNERVGWVLAAVGAPVALPAGVLVGIAHGATDLPLATTPYTAGLLIFGLAAIAEGAVGLAWLAFRAPKPRAAVGIGRRPAPPHKRRYRLHAEVVGRMNGETQVFAPGVIRLFDHPTGVIPVVSGGIAPPGTNAGRDAGLPPVSVGANHTSALGGGVWEVPAAVPQSAVGTLTSRPQPTPPGGAAGDGTHASPRSGAAAAGGGPPHGPAAGRQLWPQLDDPRRAATRRGPDENA